MKHLVFAGPTGPTPGLLLPGDTGVLDLGAAGLGLDISGSPLDWCNLDGALLVGLRARLKEGRLEPKALDGLRAQGAVRRLAELELCAPVPRPGKVLCIGLNYRDHAEESGMALPERPLLFSKFPTSVVGPGAAVRLPRGSEQVDYEAELAVVVGRRMQRVPAAEAAGCVFGYANLNDVSARDFQFADGQWQRGKSCDTFAPLGPWIVTPEELGDPHSLRIRFRLNGKTLQDSNTNQLIFGIPALLEAISEDVTLEPGDVIATGTPPGVGFARKPPVWVRAGDRMEVEIEGLGILSNPVVPG